MTDKPVTVRLRNEQIDRLMGIAIIDDSNVAELLRQAVDDFITRRLADPDLDQQLADAHARQSDVLSALTRR